MRPVDINNLLAGSSTERNKELQAFVPVNERTTEQRRSRLISDKTQAFSRFLSVVIDPGQGRSNVPKRAIGDRHDI